MECWVLGVGEEWWGGEGFKQEQERERCIYESVSKTSRIVPVFSAWASWWWWWWLAVGGCKKKTTHTKLFRHQRRMIFKNGSCSP